MSPSPALLATLGAILALLGFGAWWLLHVTEGAYVGPRFVVWLYDLSAARYDRIKDLRESEEAIDLGVPLAELLLADGMAGPDARVLDVATGTGRLPIALLSMPMFDGKVVGVDLSARMLELARAKLVVAEMADRVTLLHHPATPLPFDGRSFHAVCLLEALEFLPDSDACLAELYRVLVPGGHLLITQRIDRQARLMPGKAESREAFIRRLEKHGFVDMVRRPWTTLYDQVWACRPNER